MNSHEPGISRGAQGRRFRSAGRRFVGFLGDSLRNPGGDSGQSARNGPRPWFERLKTDWELSVSLVLLASILISSACLQIHNISCSMPYPGSNDEPILTSPAGNMLKTGDFNPHDFCHPSLPIYLTAAAFTVGFVNAAAHLDLRSTAEIGDLAYPYFTHPRIVWPAKLLFVGLSLCVMLFLGFVAYSCYERAALLFLAPLALFFSDTFFRFSQEYMSVDIVGAFFVMCVYLHLFLFLENDTVWHKSLVPGALSGLALGCKYNLYMALLPAALAILFFSKEHRGHKILWLPVAMGAAFLLCVPYSLLDFSTFLSNVGFVVYHYQAGHEGNEGPAGFPQLMHYLKAITGDFGYGSAALAILGFAACLAANWRKTVIFLSFPLVLLAYMCGQKVNFIRNVISLFPVYALFAAAGLIVVGRLARRGLSAPAFARLPGKLRWTASLLAVAGIFGAVFPISRPAQWASTKPDTRTLATDWIQRNLPKRSTIVAPEELPMDLGPIEAMCRIQRWAFRDLDDAAFRAKAASLRPAYVLMPVFGLDRRKMYAKRPGKELADRLNGFNKYLAPAQAFPGNPIMINRYPDWVVSANPALTIGRIQLPSGALPGGASKPTGTQKEAKPAGHAK